jgi:LPXTG-motif cell wall-anchored protein
MKEDEMEIRPNRRTKVVALLILSATAVLGTPAISSAYPPAPPSGQRSLAVTIENVCVGDVPYLDYAITPIGFDSAGPAELTLVGRNGSIVDVRSNAPLSGRFIYPGAAAGADGSALGWPGWKLVNGEWQADSTDSYLRDGLSITVNVNPTATATTIGYPDATSECAGPGASAAPTGSGQDPRGVLPQTGTDLRAVSFAAASLFVGLVLAIVSRRRRVRTLAA